jgi:hypothetical protein
MIYDGRASKLIQVATAGSGVLPAGKLPSFLVDELAKEAAKTADHFLGMCIRALDYCPPVGLTFGDYLRALVTSDRDMVPEDPHGYRIALIDAFRKRGIFAPGVPFLSEKVLAWPSGKDFEEYDAEWLLQHLQKTTNWLRYEGDREKLDKKTHEAAKELHTQLTIEPQEELFSFGRICGLALDPKTAPAEIERDGRKLPKFEIHQFRTAFRARPDGTLLNHVVISLTQCRRGIPFPDGQGTYDFRGGATLILDLDTMDLRHCIRRSITDDERRLAYETYMMEELPRTVRARFIGGRKSKNFEPFAFLHGEEWKGGNYAQ